MKCYIGLDVSLATTVICAVDENGAIIKEGVAASDPDEIANWLEQLGVFCSFSISNASLNLMPVAASTRNNN